MNRAQRNLNKTGAALLACSLLGTAVPSSFAEVPAAAISAPSPTATTPASAATPDPVPRTVPVDTARPVPSPSPYPVPPTRTARVSPPAADPFVCALVGIIPLASGYYLTSAPTKGIAFSLADAVLIGSIWNIRRDDNIPDRDVAPYFFLLGAVNALDAVLSTLQARNDAVRIRTTLTPAGEPTVGLAWTF